MIFLYIFGALVLLILLLSAVLPRRYNVSQTIVINAATEKVFNHVANLNHYRNWNPWQRMDPATVSDVAGTPKSIGHKYSWEGKKTGMGSLTIRSISENRNIEFALEFIKPWKAMADDLWNFQDQQGSCSVTWRNTGELPWPMARLMGPMINRQLHRQFEQGLKNLKEACEA